MLGKHPRITVLLNILSVCVLVLGLATVVAAKKPRKKSKKQKETAEQMEARIRQENLERVILLSASAPAPAPRSDGLNGAASLNPGSAATSAPSSSGAQFVADEVRGPGLGTNVVATAGQLVISEFRVRGPSGANDEFIEVANNSGADHTVTALSGTGYGIAASDGVTRCSIPNGTVIPNKGHYLCVNNNATQGYSLASYPAGNGTTATGDATYTTD